MQSWCNNNKPPYLVKHVTKTKTHADKAFHCCQPITGQNSPGMVRHSPINCKTGLQSFLLFKTFSKTTGKQSYWHNKTLKTLNTKIAKVPYKVGKSTIICWDISLNYLWRLAEHQHLKKTIIFSDVFSPLSQGWWKQSWSKLTYHIPSSRPESWSLPWTLC